MTHPDDLVEGVKYLISWDDGETMARIEGCFQGLTLHDRCLMVIVTRKSYCDFIPWTSIKEPIRARL